MSEIIA